MDYAEQNGYEVVGESFDDNVSGMTLNRKDLAELEDAVDEGKIEVVLITECSSCFIAKNRTLRGKEYVEYTCNSNHRYGKQNCTPHRIRELQLDDV